MWNLCFIFLLAFKISFQGICISTTKGCDWGRFAITIHSRFGESHENKSKDKWQRVCFLRVCFQHWTPTNQPLHSVTVTTFLLQVKFSKIAHRTKLFTQLKKYILVLFNSYNLLSSTIIKKVHEVINLRSSLIWEQLVNKVLINISLWNTHKPKISWYFTDIEFLFKELLSHYTVWVHKVNLPLIIPKIPKQA